MAADSAINAAAAAVEQQAATSATDILDAVIDESIAKRAARFAFAKDVGMAAAQSKAFPDVETGSQATMRIVAGDALGLHEFVALKELKFIKGNVTLSGNLIAALMRRAGYTWGFLKHDENGCELAFFKDGNPLIDPATKKQATISFTRKEAEQADLTGPRGQGKEKGMYEKYPRSMYFYGCIRQFPRFYAPEVTNGIVVYTPDELGAEVDQTGRMTEPPAAAPQMPKRKEAAE